MTQPLTDTEAADILGTCGAHQLTPTEALNLAVSLTRAGYVLTELLPPGVHAYLSTGCLHDRHDYCQSMTGHAGSKRPAQCKFCDATCMCPCHRQSERDRLAQALRDSNARIGDQDTQADPRNYEPSPTVAEVVKALNALPDGPTPIPGVTLDHLQSMSQPIEHCGTPMRYVVGRTSWEGPPGRGIELMTSNRLCATCGATVDITTKVPS